MTLRRLIGIGVLLLLAAPTIVAWDTAQQPIAPGPIPPLPTLPPILGDPYASPTPILRATVRARSEARSDQQQGWIFILPDGKAMTDHGIVAMGDRYDGSTVVAITPEGIVLADGRTIRPTPQGALPAATVPPLLPPVQPVQPNLPGLPPTVQPGVPMGVVLTTLAAREHVTVIVDPALAAQPVTGSWRWHGFAATARAIVAEAGGSLIEHNGIWYAVRGIGEVRTIPLANADPQQVAAALQQADPSVRVLAAPKSVILIGQIGDLLQVEGIVQQLDRSQDQYVVIPTHGVSADALTKIAQTLGAAISGGHVTADPVHGTIIVTGSPQAIALARALAPQMVQSVQTLAIHVAAIDYVPRDDNVHLGAIFQQGANGSPFQFLFPLSSTAPFTAILNLLRSHGEAKVLSDITITDLSGSEKKLNLLNLGEQYPVVIPNGGLNGGYTQGQTINTGLTIDVTPIAGADGGVTATLSFSFLRVLGTNQLGIPITSREEDSGTYFFTPTTHLLLTGR